MDAVEKEDVNEAMRLMEMSKDSLQADKSGTTRLVLRHVVMLGVTEVQVAGRMLTQNPLLWAACVLITVAVCAGGSCKTFLAFYGSSWRDGLFKQRVHTFFSCLHRHQGLNSLKTGNLTLFRLGAN